MIDKGIAEEKAELSAEEQADAADEWLSRRLDAGLYTLQTVDTVLAWLVAEDESAKTLVLDTLADRGEGLGVIKKTLEGKQYQTVPSVEINTLTAQLDSINKAAEDEDPEGKDMLATLISFL